MGTLRKRFETRPTAAEEAHMSKPWRSVLIVLILSFLINVSITYFTMY